MKREPNAVMWRSGWTGTLHDDARIPNEMENDEDNDAETYDRMWNRTLWPDQPSRVRVVHAGLSAHGDPGDQAGAALN
ncbi:MAG: hypothetical protein FIA97_18555 [Methylococcaceae bacterium]|nr:hypothetical protein [Methylococcaceae bacterium]